MTDRDEIQIRPEAKVAARWWANTFREEPRTEIGDVEKNAWIMWARENSPKIGVDEEVLIEFEQQLAEEIEDNIQSVGIWETDDEQWQRLGKDKRALRVDYHPCDVLRAAADAVGVDTGVTTFPPKTPVYVDPGKVSVQNGVSADVVTIWDAGDD